MRFATALFVLVAVGIVAVWAWLGAGVQMPLSPFAAGEKLNCISYAPFRARQDPFGPDVPIDPRQIDDDLTQLALTANCVRTYSVDHGLDQIPEIAKRHGLKMMLGLWLSSLPDLSRKQVEVAVALANRYPDVIQAVVVGNEVLLRGEMSAPALAETIRQVKARVPMPVTYADVWEFWLRNRDLAARGRFHHHSHPAVLGGLPDSGARRRAACRRHPQAGGGGLSRQGNLDRRGRLAERRPHARRRLAVPVNQARDIARGVGAGASGTTTAST